MKNSNLILLFAICLLGCKTETPEISGKIKLSRLFSDQMVLQRNQPIRIWGWGTPGVKLSLSLNNRKVSSFVSSNGKWKVQLPAMKAGGPYELVMSTKQDTIQLKDIWVGDVWLCSGQSNMEWLVANSDNAESEIAMATDPMIRHFKIPPSFSKTPVDTLVGGIWEVNNPNNTGNFSAVGYFFAKNLRAHHDVPIGLLNSTWGGSRIETWLAPKEYGPNPEEKIDEALSLYEGKFQKTIENLKQTFPGLGEKERGLVEGHPIWAASNLKSEDWKIIEAPGKWENQGFEGFDGVAWYRKEIRLTQSEANSATTISLSKIDDSDITYINGQEIGTTSVWDTDRVYEIPKGVLKVGKNQIAIRVEDTGAGGGIHGEPKDMFIQTAKKRIPLDGEWKFKLDVITDAVYQFYPWDNVPCMLNNQMIHPIKKFPIAGVIWYQGESNAGTPEEAIAYKDQFQTMIQNWREDWGIGDFPFLYVQLANWLEVPEAPKESNWAILRQSQTAALQMKNTGQAITIDIGDAKDIHPRNKQDVGKRLSLAARKMVYGEDIIYSSPMYKSHTIEDSKFIIEFDYVGKGLMTVDSSEVVKGFAIAGKDKKFVWAEAMLQDGKVIVQNRAVLDPVYLRYAWADNPGQLNLVNSEGLPTTPFVLP